MVSWTSDPRVPDKTETGVVDWERRDWIEDGMHSTRGLGTAMLLATAILIGFAIAGAIYFGGAIS